MLAYKYGEQSDSLVGRNLALDIEGSELTLRVDLTPNFHTRNKAASAFSDGLNFLHNHHRLKYVQCNDNLVRARLIRAWEAVSAPTLRMQLDLGVRGWHTYLVVPHSLFMGGIQLDVQQLLESSDHGPVAGHALADTRASHHHRNIA